jgi:hypothetical protein
MGKSRIRGRRGLYLKGKEVVRLRDFVPNLISNRIGDSFKFDFIDSASVLFLRPEVFTEHGMSPSWHRYREGATTIREERRTQLAAVGRRWTAQGGPASTGNGGHGQVAPCSGNGNGHWAGFGTELGSGRFGRVGHFVGCTEIETGGVEWRGWPGRAW